MTADLDERCALESRVRAEETVQTGLRLIRAAGDPRVGTIYLVHFARPFSHARHYIGWTSDLEARIIRHLRGRGSNLLRHVQAAGISWEVVGTWEGTRSYERSLKDRRQTPLMCPVCREGKRVTALRKWPLPAPYVMPETVASEATRLGLAA